MNQLLRLLPAVLASGQAHLSGLAGGPPDRPDASGWRNEGGTWMARTTRIGWADGDLVYLDPDAAYAEVQRLAATQRQPVTMSPRTLWKRVHERGLLAEVDARGGKTRFAVRKTIGGVSHLVIVFRASQVFPPVESVQSGQPDANPDGGNGLAVATRPMASVRT